METKEPTGWAQFVFTVTRQGLLVGDCTLIVLIKITNARPNMKPNKLSFSNKSDFHVRPAVVFDLDETLIHASFVPFPNHPHKVEVKVGKDSLLFNVAKRPYVEEILNILRQDCELILYTAARQEYADSVLEGVELFQYFDRCLYREQCISRPKPEAGYYKDLNLLGRDMSTVLLVDDAALALERHPENCISVPAWVGEPSDDALLGVLTIVMAMSAVQDVRLLTGFRNTTFGDLTNNHAPLCTNSHPSSTNFLTTSSLSNFSAKRKVPASSFSPPASTRNPLTARPSLKQSHLQPNNLTATASNSADSSCIKPYVPPPPNESSTAWVLRALDTLASTNSIAAKRTLKVLQSSGAPLNLISGQGTWVGEQVSRLLTEQKNETELTFGVEGKVGGSKKKK